MVFEGDNVMVVCAHHLNTIPPPPSSRTDRTIPSELERLLLACLAKKPSERPTSRELADALAAIPANGWTSLDAGNWWTEFEKAPREAVSPVADTIAVLPHHPGAP
jgi:hypothetical protein